MKALELVVYPKLERPIFGHQVEGFRAQWRAEVELGQAKRLTDAELAAEYWRKVGDYDACTEGYTTATDGYAYESGATEGERMMAFHHFATLPHYDEAEQ